MTSNPTVKTIRPGNTSSPDPFTICVVANPALEVPVSSNNFISDPILSDQNGFDVSVNYISDCLFGKLPGQAERFLADPSIEPRVKMISIFDSSPPAKDANSLVGEFTDLLEARRAVFSKFLANYGLKADIVYAVSDSPRNTRASAWFTSDDQTQPGTPFIVNGTTWFHRFFCRVPGAIAIHKTADTLTALHEFGHALSSYENGMVVDLYVDSNPALNCKRGRPIPVIFGTYNANSFNSDLTRNGIGYEAGWTSYHCELIATTYPAVMDNYYLSKSTPEQCEHDSITRAFLRDRLVAKVNNR